MCSWFVLAGESITARALSQETATISIQPGDTWAALATRYRTTLEELKALNPHLNRQRQPTIGSPFFIPTGSVERSGRLIRVQAGSLVSTAAQFGQPLWRLATLNNLKSPYRPLLVHPVYIPGEETIRELPIGIESLELSAIPAAPGQALGLRGEFAPYWTDSNISATLDTLPVMFASAGNHFAGVVGTGAFYSGGEPELTILTEDHPAWIQPWKFFDRDWEYQELTLTGEAGEIDQQARDEERARLRELWTESTPSPLWTTSFATPINDYLLVSANYGARRSYNGGPYLTYHEGVDYSAYAGTPVYAPAAGKVVLAERLYVRGGAVIIDHGLGVFSGYYHLSAVHATPGQIVRQGDLLGEVGTTGLSTGNHLHWDLLINGVWVDAAIWQQQDMGCWLLSGLGESCLQASD